VLEDIIISYSQLRNPYNFRLMLQNGNIDEVVYLNVARQNTK